MGEWPDLVWLVRDRWGRDIVLYEDTWHNHILLEHRNLRGHDAAVAKVLSDPYRVMHDAWHETRENYYRPRTHPRYPDLFLKVCVEFDPGDTGWAGVVVTAFLTPNIGAEEVQRWPQRS